MEGEAQQQAIGIGNWLVTFSSIQMKQREKTEVRHSYEIS